MDCWKNRCDSHLIHSHPDRLTWKFLVSKNVNVSEWVHTGQKGFQENASNLTDFQKKKNLTELAEDKVPLLWMFAGPTEVDATLGTDFSWDQGFGYRHMWVLQMKVLIIKAVSASQQWTDILFGLSSTFFEQGALIYIKCFSVILVGILTCCLVTVCEATKEISKKERKKKEKEKNKQTNNKTSQKTQV